MSAAATIKGLFTGLGMIKQPLEKSLGIIDQLVTDKDEANRLKAQVYMTELQTTTIPIVDAFHKMGRQIMAFAQMWFYYYCVKNNIPITMELVAGVSGVAAAYTLVKGVGK